MAERVQDFGEHIGLSRKELYEMNHEGLSMNTLRNMTPEMRSKYVRRDVIWPKPDYDKMVKEGIPASVAVAIQEIRNSIPQTKPTSGYGFQKITDEDFVEAVQEIRKMTEGWKTEADVFPEKHEPSVVDAAYVNPRLIQLSNLGFIKRDPADRSYLRGVGTTDKGRIIGLSMRIMGKAYNLSQHDCVRLAQDRQYGVDDDQKLPRGYAVEYAKSNSLAAMYGYTSPETWYVRKGRYFVSGNFKTEEEARQYAMQQKIASKSKAKTRFHLTPLEHVTRTGPDYREGKDAEPTNFETDLRLRGGEFGNYLSNKETRQNMDLCYDAFRDLGDALGLTPEEIGIGGRLGIAFGARGRGGNAAAHYEPELDVINLTKKHGAGSLAHEYIHAVDDALGTSLGAKGVNPLATERTAQVTLPRSLVELMGKMQKHPMSGPGLEEWKEFYLQRKQKELCAELEQISAKDGVSLVDIIIGPEKTAERNRIAGEYLRSQEPPDKAIEPLLNFYKDHTGHTMNVYAMRKISALKEDVQYAIENTDSYRYQSSVFLLKSKEMDNAYAKSGNGYWASNCEMLARAGACYVEDKLREMGRRSDYLTGHADLSLAIPLGEERKIIDAAFEIFFRDMRVRGLFLPDDIRKELQQDTVRVRLDKYNAINIADKSHNGNDLYITMKDQVITVTDYDSQVSGQPAMVFRAEDYTDKVTAAGGSLLNVAEYVPFILDDYMGASDVIGRHYTALNDPRFTFIYGSRDGEDPMLVSDRQKMTILNPEKVKQESSPRIHVSEINPQQEEISSDLKKNAEHDASLHQADVPLEKQEIAREPEKQASVQDPEKQIDTQEAEQKESDREQKAEAAKRQVESQAEESRREEIEQDKEKNGKLFDVDTGSAAALSACATAGIVTAIRAGNLERYLSSMSRFPAYSLNNIGLIAAQNPEATDIAGYRSWQTRGFQVKRGETGIKLVQPYTWTSLGPDGSSVQHMGFHMASVFDRSQVFAKENIPDIDDRSTGIQNTGSADTPGIMKILNENIPAVSNNPKDNTNTDIERFAFHAAHYAAALAFGLKDQCDINLTMAQKIGGRLTDAELKKGLQSARIKNYTAQKAVREQLAQRTAPARKAHLSKRKETNIAI